MIVCFQAHAYICATHNSDNLKWNQQILDHLCADSCVLQ